MRRLAAALACRNNGLRLFGKPLQPILDQTTILDQIVASLKGLPEIDAIVLGVSEGTVNTVYADVARAHGIGHIFGDAQDVLMRLIQCGRAADATDVFRVTTECPWFAWEMLEAVWAAHRENGNDITVSDRLPEGLNFEIYSLAALERAHEQGSRVDRSEFCSNYPRTHPDEFRAQVFLPPAEWRRGDLRITVDYPEDLIVARAIARACADTMPLVPTGRIIEFLDGDETLKRLVAPYVDPQPLWAVFTDQKEWRSNA